MRNLFTYSIFALTCFLLNCTNDTEKISITPTISIDFPKAHTIIENYKETAGTSYEAKAGEDKLSIFSYPFYSLQSFSFNEKKESMETNVLGYISTLRGKRLSYSEEVIGETLLSNFSFEFEENDSLYTMYGNYIVEDFNIIIISIKTLNPISQNSKKTRDRFLNSLRIKSDSN
ncbi:MAG: hypothetical protein QNK30_09800 [Bacteroidales bacterium]|nr:hypothetical protein [Bacteroidales bacterium]